MKFIDALHLLQLSVKHDIIQQQDGNLLIYHNAGNPPKKFPAGWYLEDMQSVAQDLMTDEEGQSLLIKALKEKGVQFEGVSDRFFVNPFFNSERS